MTTLTVNIMESTVNKIAALNFVARVKANDHRPCSRSRRDDADKMNAFVPA